MTLRFCKMHGLGNDFVVIDATINSYQFTAAQIAALADRRTGIGFDQLLLIEPTQNPAADFYYRIYNADGTIAEQCGNGARCVTRYILERGLLNGKKLRLATAVQIIHATLLENKEVKVAMGVPNFPRSHAIELSINQTLVRLLEVNMGNPHAVIRVDNLDAAPVREWGVALNAHDIFPQGVNVEFVQVINPTTLKLRVYERGAGETAACGSGACAAVAAACYNHWLDQSQFIQVQQRGGSLGIYWPFPGADLTMQGAATFVFDGETCKNSDIIVE